MSGAIVVLSCILGSAIWGTSESDVDRYLNTLRAQEPSFNARLKRIAEDALGTPYAVGPLGEGPEGTHDTDPLIDLKRVDCVTFVEQSLALASAATYQEAFARLQCIRYKGGKVGFETRNHFMETDWVENNSFCHDVTQTLGVPIRTETRTISQRDFFQRAKAPELGQTIPDRQLALAYIPVEEAEHAEAFIPSPSLVCFVGKLDWLFVLHCGLYLRDDDGTGHLYQASSKAGRVVVGSLADFFKNTDRYLGFAVYRLQDPADSTQEDQSKQ